jgi:3-methylcrotonyl-CoA carboxylase alpha subunit
LLSASLRFDSGGCRAAVDGAAAALDAATFDAPDDDTVYVLRRGRQTVVRRAVLGGDAHDGAGGDGVIKAPMHGKVLALMVAEGDSVVKGQRLAIVEAMKMEHALTAPITGIVAGIAVQEGAQVAEGARLMDIRPAGE